MCEYGVTIVDAVTGVVTLGQFADDVLRSRMVTLLASFRPSEVCACVDTFSSCFALVIASPSHLLMIIDCRRFSMKAEKMVLPKPSSLFSNRPARPPPPSNASTPSNAFRNPLPSMPT